MLGQYKCMHVDHEERPILGICQNQFCKQPFRRVCQECYKIHEQCKVSNVKDEKDIQRIIDEFKENNKNIFNNIKLQCWIQEYMLNLEIIENTKLWNHKNNIIHQIRVQSQKLQNQEFQKISIGDYLNNEKKDLFIDEYLSYFQEKLLELNDKKDDYIKNKINQTQYQQSNSQEYFDTISKQLISEVNKIQDRKMQEITTNEIFKQHHQINENYMITFCEIMLDEGQKLETDSIYQKFENYQKIILQDRQIEDYLQYYIQSYAIANKYSKNTQQIDTGLCLIDQSLKLKISNPKSYNIKGKLYEQAGKYEKAMKMFNKAIELDPRLFIAYLNKGTLLNKQSKYEETIKVLDQALQLDSKSADANFQKGLSLLGLKKYQNAIQSCEKAIKLDPKDIYAYECKGSCLYGLEQYDEAIQVYDQVMKLDPTNALDQQKKVISLYQIKQFQHQKQNYQGQLNQQPNDNYIKNLISQCDDKIQKLKKI